MSWPFDQGPNVACLTSGAVIDGQPVLFVKHFDDDDSWVFWHGTAFAYDEAMVVGMKTVLDRHPDVVEVADVPPGWSAARTAVDQPWTKQRDDDG